MSGVFAILMAGWLSALLVLILEFLGRRWLKRARHFANEDLADEPNVAQVMLGQLEANGTAARSTW